MKQKLGFPGMLLPFGKDKNTKRRRAIYKLIAAKFREKVSYIDHYYIAIIIVLAALIILAWSCTILWIGIHYLKSWPKGFGISGKKKD